MNTPSRMRSLIAWTMTLVIVLVTSDATASVSGGTATLTLTARNRPLAELLVRIGERFRVSIVSRAALAQPVSVALRGLTLDEALRAVLEPVGGTFHREGRIVTVSTGSGSPHTTEPTSAENVSDAVSVTQVRASDVARAVQAQFRALHADVVGDSVLLTGKPADVARAKALIALLDVPGASASYSLIYRLHFVDAKSVEALVRKSFPGVQTSIEPDLNVLSVMATGMQHARIATAIAQVDVAPNAELGTATDGSPDRGLQTQNAGGAPYVVEVVGLKAAVPNAASGAPSTTPVEVATTVQQTLAAVAPELRLVPVPNEPQLIVSGTPYSVKIAKELIARIDKPQKLVVLDTQILEVNESVAKNLGLSFAPNTVVTTTYSETTPQPNALGNAIPLLGLQPLSRTPLSLQFQLGLAISQGKGRILADPRITTLSGKTASIRAGDNLTVLTQSGGGTGVAVTTQLQTFNTGVSHDITPIVNADNYVTINLHPVVNNVSSISSAGIPQISTRDTQTTIGIREGQTLVIGGLIQDSSTRTTNKIPLLGDLPLVGPIFRNEQVDNTRDELIITITPHIFDPMQSGQLVPLPSPAPLPPVGQESRTFSGATFPPLPGQSPVASGAGPISVFGVRARRAGVIAPAVALTLPPVKPVTLPPIPRGALPTPTPTATPQASPTAFTNTNVFTFGTAPANNYAGTDDEPQIFYATLSPTVLKNTTNVNVSTVTTSNVTKVTIGYDTTTVPLTSVGLGKWQASYAFSTAGIPSDRQGIDLMLTASRTDGTSTSISIPVNVTQ